MFEDQSQPVTGEGPAIGETGEIDIGETWNEGEGETGIGEIGSDIGEGEMAGAAAFVFKPSTAPKITKVMIANKKRWRMKDLFFILFIAQANLKLRFFVHLLTLGRFVHPNHLESLVFVLQKVAAHFCLTRLNNPRSPVFLCPLNRFVVVFEK